MYLKIAEDIKQKYYKDNFSNDGQQYVLGIEFKPVKGIRISPNSQLWSGRNGVNIYLYSLNLELKM